MEAAATYVLAKALLNIAERKCVMNYGGPESMIWNAALQWYANKAQSLAAKL